MANNTLIEGLDDNQKTGLLQVIIPAADALETVSVSTSNYDAEFGRSGGAVTNVTLKSGTNDLKGSAFFFGNNEKTNASDYFTPPQGADQVRQRRLHARRADRQEQAVLLRRLPAHDRQHRLRRPRDGADGGDAERRLQRGDASGIYDPTTGDVNGAEPRRRSPTTRSRRTASARSRSKLLAFIPAAEHRRRAARPEQLPAGAGAREDHRRLRHEGQLHGEREGPDVVSSQLHAARSCSIPGCSASTAGRPTAASPAPARTPATARAGDLDARVQRHDRARRPRRPELLPQRHDRRQAHGLTTSTDVGIPGANLDEFTSGISQINIGGYGGSAARLLGQPAVGPVGEDLERRRRR